MKVDILVSSLRGGGAERVAANLADAWHEARHDVRLIAYEPLQTVEYRPLAGVELVSLAPRRTSAVARLISLRRMLDRRRADIVIAVQANMAIEAALATVGLGLRVIGCEHNTPERSVRGKLWRFLRPWAYRQLAAVTALTAGAAAELRRLCPRTNVVVIPNVLRLPLAENSPRLDPEALVPPAAPLLLAAGRMVEAKGFDRMIAYFAHVAGKHPDARLVILGDGPLRSQLVQQTHELGLGDRVLFPGRAGNMEAWYVRASLYVMTSRWEGMPMVLLEAMAHGVPVVATDFRHGPRDVIREGIDGVILPEGDPGAWTDAVLDLLQDNEKRQAMSSDARNVTQRFNEAEVLRQWQHLFDRLIETAVR